MTSITNEPQTTEPREHHITANGLVHHVLVWNADAPGEPIILAHGFLDYAWSFSFLAQHLGALSRPIIAFDWRGHGETEWIGRGGYYHFADYVLDLHELVPQLLALTGARRFHLLGHSMGGTACAMFASTRSALSDPRALASLTLCEGLGPPGVGLDGFADRLLGFVQSVARERASRKPRSIANIDEAIARMRVQHADLDAAQIRFLAEKGTRATPDGTLMWRFDPLHRTSSPAPFLVDAFCIVLGRIDVPTLVVSGSRGFRPPDEAARIAAIPGAKHEVLEDVGHMMHWHAPDRLAALLASHIARVTAET